MLRCQCAGKILSVAVALGGILPNFFTFGLLISVLSMFAVIYLAACGYVVRASGIVCMYATFPLSNQRIFEDSRQLLSLFVSDFYHGISVKHCHVCQYNKKLANKNLKFSGSAWLVSYFIWKIRENGPVERAGLSGKMSIWTRFRNVTVWSKVVDSQSSKHCIVA